MVRPGGRPQTPDAVLLALRGSAIVQVAPLASPLQASRAACGGAGGVGRQASVEEAEPGPGSQVPESVLLALRGSAKEQAPPEARPAQASIAACGGPPWGPPGPPRPWSPPPWPNAKAGLQARVEEAAPGPGSQVPERVLLPWFGSTKVQAAPEARVAQASTAAWGGPPKPSKSPSESVDVEEFPPAAAPLEESALGEVAAAPLPSLAAVPPQPTAAQRRRAEPPGRIQLRWVVRFVIAAPSGPSGAELRR
jgi:hypothetical protein